jgi:hypothetical protein
MQANVSIDGVAGIELARGDLAGLDRLDAEGVAVFLFSDVRPVRGVAGYVDWRLCGELSRCIERGLFAAAAGETMLLPTAGRFGRRRVFVFGLGLAHGADESRFRSAVRTAVEVMRRAGVETLALAAPAADREGAAETRFVRAVAAEMPDQGVRVLVEA